MEERYKIGDVVLGNWKLTSALGEGSFGKVFAAEREDFGRTYKAAIKIITIPQNQSEVKSVMADGMDRESVTTYFQGFVNEMVDEFALMSELKGHSNVVSYEDHSVVEHAGEIGWDIIIRMELLTPLLDYIAKNKMTRKDVIQLGVDMCRALELCQKFNIIHRDIKPENIFVSEIGDYKLGDFGIARTVEKTNGGLSKKGTYTYMAPEVYKEEPYGSGVDIYSLGIVLYRLLNDNRTPFLPDYPAPITYADREKSLTRRIAGVPIPKPKNAEGRLAEIVLKACAYDPKDRYSSPLLMRQELEAILYNQAEAPVIYPAGDEVPFEPSERSGAAPDAAGAKVFVPEAKEPSEKTVGLFDGFAEEQGPENAAEDAAAPDAEEANENAAGLYGCFDGEIPAERQSACVQEEPETEILPEDAPEERTVKTEPPRPAAAPPVPPKAPAKQREPDWKKAAKNKKTLTAIIIGAAVLVCVALMAALGVFSKGAKIPDNSGESAAASDTSIGTEISDDSEESTAASGTSMTSDQSGTNRNPVKLVYSDGQEMIYQYDSQGNKTRQTKYVDGKANITVDYKYNSAGKIIEEDTSLPGEGIVSVVKYKYGSTSLPESSYDESGSTKFKYDSSGKLVRETRYDENGNACWYGSLGYENGRLVKEVFSGNDDTTITYKYDSNGRITEDILTSNADNSVIVTREYYY